MRFTETIKERGGLKSGDFDPFVRNFKKGETEIRFLFPTQDWVVFREHYIEKRSVPCTRQEDCFGCNREDPDEAKSTEKVATNIWTAEYEKVDVYRVPKGIYNSVLSREERRGTVTDRNAIIDKTGQGLRTEYQIDWEDAEKMDIEGLQAQAHDINALLVAQYEQATSGAVESKPKSSQVVFSEKELRAMSRDELAVLAEDNGVDGIEDLDKKGILAAMMAQV